MRKISKKIMSAVLGLVTAISILPSTALAAGSVETDRNVTLEIQYKYGSTVLSNVEFELYRVADISEYAQFTLTDDFKQYPVEIGEYSGAAWNELATTLDGYITRDASKPEGPKAVDSGKTDDNGKLTFPNTQDEMKPGLYLVIGSTKRTDSYRYICDPAIVCIPGEDREANEWVYDVSIFPKSSRKSIPDDDNPSGGSSVTRKVLKRWSDSGHEDVRPNSIEVSLWKNGQEYDSVTLNSSNNWSYTWTGLDKSATWKVTENVPDGYTVAIGREGNTFVVKNSYISTTEITDNDIPKGDKPSGDWPSDVLDAHDGSMPFGVLPQTGTTWWLAATLAGAGMLFLAFALALSQSKNKMR